MKREIKFRAWLPIDRKNDPQIKGIMDINICVQNSERLMHGNSDSMRNPDNYCYKDDRWILMQYTGKKDKNNNEVFEGDILNIESHGKYQVKWDSEFNCWTTELLDKIGTEHFMYNNFFNGEWNSHYVEIIGNVYENSDLLNS